MCNAAIGGLVITRTLPEFTSGVGAARTLLSEAHVELEDALATGQLVTLRLVKCAGVGQWSIIMDQHPCEEPVQLPLPLELGICLG